VSEIENYIKRFPPAVQKRLHALRAVFLERLPAAEEQIRYQMPSYRVGRHHLYFAAYKKHIGFYPVYHLAEMEQELAPYRAPKTKDTLHFLHTQPLPLELVKKIIEAKRKS
jgi:uncharacterized protein YdhG (YjbR/CyaY superfamily)